MIRAGWMLLCCIIVLTSCSPKVTAPSSSARISEEISAGLLGNWEQLGIQKGQPVPDFTLHSEKGKVFNLKRELGKGKPVVLISGSYTCDVSRGNMEAIRNLQKKYGDKATFFMIYTIDAHPFDSPSPYSAERKVWIAKNNTRDNVKAAQPKTYAERVELAHKWRRDNSIEFPVLIDAPDNFYWKKFGQAPNMVYIITPRQTVFFKQAWFNRERLEREFEDLRNDKLSAD